MKKGEMIRGLGKFTLFLILFPGLPLLWAWYTFVGPGYWAEFNDVKHVRGTCSMARSSSPNSANSQFFICFEPAPFLDRQYTVWGQVIDGMEFVDKIKLGSSGNNGSVKDPDFMVKVSVGKAKSSAKAKTNKKK